MPLDAIVKCDSGFNPGDCFEDVITVSWTSSTQELAFGTGPVVEACAELSEGSERLLNTWSFERKKNISMTKPKFHCNRRV